MFNELWFIPYPTKTGDKKLAGTRKPDSLAEVHELEANNVAAIISLLDDKENQALYTTADMPFLWLPITGGTAMTTEQAQTAYDYINAMLADKSDNACVAVHCSNGHKRTGMVLAAVQILHGLDSETAIANVVANNPQAAKMNAKQREFLSALGSVIVSVDEP